MLDSPNPWPLLPPLLKPTEFWSPADTYHSISSSGWKCMGISSHHLHRFKKQTRSLDQTGFHFHVSSLMQVISLKLSCPLQKISQAKILLHIKVKLSRLLINNSTSIDNHIMPLWKHFFCTKSSEDKHPFIFVSSFVSHRR